MTTLPAPRSAVAGKWMLLLATVSAITLSAPPARAMASVSARTDEAVSERSVLRVERAAASSEEFHAGTDQMLEIMLSDRGSIALAPDSRIRIDLYAYAGGKGELRVTLLSGAMRVMAGSVAASGPVTIVAGATMLRLASGGAFVVSEAEGVRAVLQLGGPLEVSGGGRAATIQRPGFEIVATADGTPSSPRRQPQGQAYADAARINPGLTRGGMARIETGAEAEAAIQRRTDDGSLTRGEVAQADVAPPPPPPTPSPDLTPPPAPAPSPDPTPPPPPPPAPINFDNTPVQLADGGGIPLGLAATGTASSNGNGSTADAADDIALSQNHVIINSGAYKREPAPTVNRLLPADGFNYSADGLSSVPIFEHKSGEFDNIVPNNYAISTGLSELSGVGGLEQDPWEVQITPTSIADPEGNNDFPASIELDGEIFIENGQGTEYKDNIGRTIRREDDLYWIQPDIPPVTRYQQVHLLVIDGNIGLSIGSTPSSSQFTRGKILLPIKVLGSDDQIIRFSDLQTKVAANSLNSIDKLAFQKFVDNENLNGGNKYNSFDDFSKSLTDYVDSLILVNLIDVAEGATGFTGGASYATATLRSGFGNIEQAGHENDRGGRALDNFLYVEVIDPEGRRVVFATGDIGKGRSGGTSIDRFGLSRGLTPAPADEAQLTGAPTDNLGFRAFLPASSLGTLAAASITQTNLLVANPAPGAPVSTSRLYHADLGLSPDGRTSAVSATFGTITYDDNGYGKRKLDSGIANAAFDLADPRSKVGVTGSTIGSTRSGGTASTLFTSPLTATATGGGREWQTGDGAQPRDGVQLRDGHAGYLVLENFADTPDGGVTWGTSAQLGSDAEAAYGYLRLAAGYDSRPDSDAIAGAIPTSGSLHDFAGYVAGAIEQEGAGGQVDARPYLGTIALTLDPVENLASATIAYDDGAGRTLHLGARPDGAEESRAEGRSAYVEPGRYGAATQSGGANAAIIAGYGVRAGLGAAGEGIADYKHVQWGFFFGDLLPTATDAGSRRNHTALSTWVAGQRFTGDNSEVGADSAMRGSVRFGGHAIGTVITQMSGADPEIATRTGSFTQLWDLNARTGTMDLDFDGRQYSGTPLAVSGTTGLAYAGDSPVVNGLQARIQGELVSVPTPTALPEGTIGQFQIRGVDASYQANGTFAGERTSQ